MSNIILQQTQTAPFSFNEKDVVIVTHDSGEPQLVKTDALIVMPNVVMSASYQSQIDSINAQLPVKDFEVIGTTNLLANYLLNRGTL